MSREWIHEPRLLALVCNWAYYTPAERAAIEQVAAEGAARVVRVPCAGRVSPSLLVSAVQQGYDAILVVGCEAGSCHYRAGSQLARRRLETLRGFLAYLGLEPERIRLDWQSPVPKRPFRDLIAAARESGPARPLTGVEACRVVQDRRVDAASARRANVASADILAPRGAGRGGILGTHAVRLYRRLARLRGPQGSNPRSERAKTGGRVWITRRVPARACLKNVAGSPNPPSRMLKAPPGFPARTGGSAVTPPLQAAARALLSQGRVDLVLGFERGTLPLRSRPAFIRRPEEARRLVCDGFCESNLARYLRDLRGQRVAVVARGCTSRAIATLVVERQVERGDLVILGLPCPGIVDRRRVAAAAPGEILAAEDGASEIALHGHGWALRLSRQAYLSPSCRACTAPNPALYDVLIGEPVAGPSGCEPRAEAEVATPEARWAAFAAESGRCIRCYACRQACPLCYCPECFIDQPQPRWCEAGPTLAGQQFWQIMRAYHQAGRCVQCGACERACPVGIPLVHLTARLNGIVDNLFGPGAGLERDAEARGIAADVPALEART